MPVGKTRHTTRRLGSWVRLTPLFGDNPTHDEPGAVVGYIDPPMRGAIRPATMSLHVVCALIPFRPRIPNPESRIPNPNAQRPTPNAQRLSPITYRLPP